MPWDRDDYLAAAFITIIIVIGILAILWITGVIPQSDDTGYPFGWIKTFFLLGLLAILWSTSPNPR